MSDGSSNTLCIVSYQWPCKRKIKTQVLNLFQIAKHVLFSGNQLKASSFSKSKTWWITYFVATFEHIQNWNNKVLKRLISRHHWAVEPIVLVIPADCSETWAVPTYSWVHWVVIDCCVALNRSWISYEDVLVWNWEVLAENDELAHTWVSKVSKPWFAECGVQVGSIGWNYWAYR